MNERECGSFLYVFVLGVFTSVLIVDLDFMGRYASLLGSTYNFLFSVF